MESVLKGWVSKELVLMAFVQKELALTAWALRESELMGSGQMAWASMELVWNGDGDGM
jgi:hypothetical protein